MQLESQIREHIAKYYEGWAACNDPTCGYRTRMMGVYGRRCLRPDCKGTVSFEVSLRFHSKSCHLLIISSSSTLTLNYIISCATFLSCSMAIALSKLRREGQIMVREQKYDTDRSVDWYIPTSRSPRSNCQIKRRSSSSADGLCREVPRPVWAEMGWSQWALLLYESIILIATCGSSFFFCTCILRQPINSLYQYRTGSTQTLMSLLEISETRYRIVRALIGQHLYTWPMLLTFVGACISESIFYPQRSWYEHPPTTNYRQFIYFKSYFLTKIKEDTNELNAR